MSTLESVAISQDLFGEKVLLERQAFMDAQAKVPVARQEAMKEEVGLRSSSGVVRI